MAARCGECGKPFGMSRRPVTTSTGRRLCPDCHADLQGAAAGVLANPDQPVAGAIATRGWLRALRSRRRSPRPDEPPTGT